MPGRIHVAVLECSDLPPPTSSAASLYLKVAMGRKEYGSAGMADFSFPVSSLREKLVVMLCNGEANIISEKELNTMLVVEKGNWDVTLPLEGGGNVLLRLQFLLSEEERKRIQDMRNSIKRKWEETLKGGNNTASGTGAAILYSQLGEYGNSSNALSSQEVQECSEVLVPKANETSTATTAATVEKFLPLDGVQERNDSAKRCPDPLIENSEILMTRSATESSSGLKDLSCKTTRESSPDRSSNSTVRKMISAFESGLPQETRPQFTKIKSEGSLKRMAFAIGNTEEKEPQQTMSKSFSSGMLSEINVQQNPTFSESLSLEMQDNFTESVYKDFHAHEEKTKLGVLLSSESKDIETRSKVIEPEEVLSLGGDAKDFETRSKVIEPEEVLSLGGDARDFETRSKVIEPEEVPSLGAPARSVGRGNLVSIAGSEGPVKFSIQKALGKENSLISLPKGYDGHDANTGSQSSGEVAASSEGSTELENLGLGSRNLDGNGNLNIDSKHFHHSKEANLEIVNKNEDTIEKYRSQEEAQPSREVIDEFFFGDVQGFNSTCSGSHYIKPMNFGVSHDIAKLIQLNNTSCCFEMLGLWIPRHVCITTRHGQLRDLLLRNCSLCTYTPRMDQSKFIAEANNKQKMPADAFDDVKRGENISSSGEDMDDDAGFSMFHGWLIGQGMQLVLMVVACGTILMSAR
ncbi:uncharacterized protein LOC109722426 isoform X1 [Ananas comosus]|uniref:Uncharacterized protein LOC109722426 isoform X1 n=1 Tax=Ananas comosus TaxID=4615 RepID=A0A6P5GDY6_ANACO|nr:uncharacterized protein LOC109722426 isoform X1 [Ananas comosus]